MTAIVGAMLTTFTSSFFMEKGKKKILLLTNAVLVVGNLLTQIDTPVV